MLRGVVLLRGLQPLQRATAVRQLAAPACVSLRLLGSSSSSSASSGSGPADASPDVDRLKQSFAKARRTPGATIAKPAPAPGVEPKPAATAATSAGSASGAPTGSVKPGVHDKGGLLAHQRLHKTGTKGMVSRMEADNAVVSGLLDACPRSVVSFENGGIGLVVDLNANESATVTLLHNKQYPTNTKGGEAAICANERLYIPTGRHVMGRVLDPLGRPLDDGPAVKPIGVKPLLSMQSTPVMWCEPAHAFVETGYKLVDSLITWPVGSTTCLVGERDVGKARLALDVIKAQHKNNAARGSGSNPTYCVYVCVGHSDTRTTNAIQRLKESGAIGSTCVIAAPDSSSPGMQYIAPFAGLAIAQAMRDAGAQVMIVYDNLSLHHVAGTRTSMTGLPLQYGSLLVQSSQLDAQHGGGSLTSVAIVDRPATKATPQDLDASHVAELIVSSSDNIVHLTPAQTGNPRALPISLDRLALRPAPAVLPPALRANVNRFRTLFADLRSRVGGTSQALQLSIEPEGGDVDREMMLYTKIHLLLAPTDEVIALANDSVFLSVQDLLPRIANLRMSSDEIVKAAIKSGLQHTKDTEPVLPNKGALRAQLAARAVKRNLNQPNSGKHRLDWSSLNLHATPQQLTATLFAITHGFLDSVPLWLVPKYEARLWGALATLPAPSSYQNPAGHLRSVLDVLCEAPPPPGPTETTLETMRSQFLSEDMSADPVWTAVYATAHGLAETMATISPTL